MSEVITIRQVDIEDVLDLRMAVLRAGTPSTNPRYPEDGSPDSVHLAALLDGEVIATSTWLPRPWINDTTVPATQLRGMAVAVAHQGSGIGGKLLHAGVDLATDQGSHYVWARARDTAIYFYERHGFSVVGDQFMDEATGVGHHLMVRRVTPQSAH
jgi:predicted GNAT family N-acyltransferase